MTRPLTEGIDPVGLKDTTDTQINPASEDTLLLIEGDVAAAGTVGSFQKTVTTAGTRVQLDTHASDSCTIAAKTTNTGLIYVGNSGVTSANGYILDAGATISLSITNTNLVYIDSSVNGDGVSVVYVT